MKTCTFGRRPKNAKHAFVCGFFVLFLMFLCSFLCFGAKAFVRAADISFISDVGEEGIEPYMEKLSDIRQKVVGLSPEKRAEVLRFANASGFSKEQALLYAFPEVIKAINKIEEKVFVAPQNATLESVKGTGNIKTKKEKRGRRLKKDKLVNDVFDALLQGKSSCRFAAECEPIECELKEDDVKNFTFLRGGFQTSFSSSSSERKSNIALAASSLDGKIVLPGQTLSFNAATGQRGEAGGYKKAKIIKNGMFVSEFGGGVCQVSTTLYNACLLADIEVVEVHPHSLPVSYVAPCFDAMVNSGSADLVIKNTTGAPIIIATAVQNDCCKINIYGCKNNYQIVRTSQKIEDFLQITTETTKNYKDFGFASPPAEGEQIVISAGKPGYRATGTLMFYQSGVLVKTKKIRENTYLPTKRVILVG